MTQVERHRDGSSHYIARAPNASQARRYQLALIEARNWLGRERFTDLQAGMRLSSRNITSWNSYEASMGLFLGMEGFVVDALCFAYLGRDL